MRASSTNKNGSFVSPASPNLHGEEVCTTSLITRWGSRSFHQENDRKATRRVSQTALLREGIIDCSSPAPCCPLPRKDTSANHELLRKRAERHA